MKKKYLSTALGIGFLAGALYMGLPAVLGALQNPGTKFANSYANYTLLNATTTGGNSGRFATSTYTDTSGAKKVTFQFSAKATSTLTAVDFYIYGSPTENTLNTNGPSAGMGDYFRLGSLSIATTTLQNASFAGNHYYTRYGVINVRNTANLSNGTTTASVDLTFDSFRSMLCVASSSTHSEGTCKVLIER